MDQHGKVRKFAYWLYLFRGKKSGNDLENWLKAERAVEQLDDFVIKSYKFISAFSTIFLIIMIIVVFVILPRMGYTIIILR